MGHESGSPHSDGTTDDGQPAVIINPNRATDGGNSSYDFVQDGFLEPLVWNLYIFSLNQARTFFCICVGAWGIFWRNDRGDFMNACFQSGLGGNNPTDIFLERTVPVSPA